jgi:hypothetical protein
MLHEIKDVRQIEGEGIRRWFTDNYFDLIIWFDYNYEILGFQLCYAKEKGERALTWRVNNSYHHDKVDDGEFARNMKRTPILTADGIFDKNTIAEIFKRESKKIEPELAQYVYKKILEYS